MKIAKSSGRILSQGAVKTRYNVLTSYNLTLKELIIIEEK